MPHPANNFYRPVMLGQGYRVEGLQGVVVSCRRLRDMCHWHRCKSLSGWKDELKWIRAAQELNLSGQQVSNILQTRATSLAKLQQ